MQSMTPVSGLVYLLNHCQLLWHLNQELATALPVSLQLHCCVANFRMHTLIIHVDSALWATRLRYTTPTLLKHWQTLSTLPTIKRVEIRVRPATVTVKPLTPHPKPILSTQTVKGLHEVVDNITHTPLKVALQKLAASLPVSY